MEEKIDITTYSDDHPRYLTIESSDTTNYLIWVEKEDAVTDVMVLHQTEHKQDSNYLKPRRDKSLSKGVKVR